MRINNSFRFYRPFLVVFSLFLGLFTSLSIIHAADPASPLEIGITSPTQSTTPGKDIPLTLTLSTGTAKIQSSTVRVVYSGNLQYTGADYSASIFKKEDNPVITGSNTLLLSRSCTNCSFTGTNGVIATLHFVAKKDSQGSGDVTIDTSGSSFLDSDAVHYDLASAGRVSLPIGNSIAPASLSKTPSPSQKTPNLLTSPEKNSLPTSLANLLLLIGIFCLGLVGYKTAVRHQAFTRKALSLTIIGTLLIVSRGVYSFVNRQTSLADFIPQPSTDLNIYNNGSYSNGFAAGEWRNGDNEVVLVNQASAVQKDGSSSTLELDLSRYGTANLDIDPSSMPATFDVGSYATLHFRIYGSAPLQAPFDLSPMTNGWTTVGTPMVITPSAGWQDISLPMSDFGLSLDTALVGFQFRNNDWQTSTSLYGHVFISDFSLKPDLSPPAVSSLKNTDLSHLLINYSKLVDPSTAETTTNYALSSGTDSNYSSPLHPTSVSLDDTEMTATLTFATALIDTTGYSLQVNNVQDQMSPPHTITLNTVANFTSSYTPTIISVDATANTHAISPDIYGLAFAPGSTLSGINAASNRWGGNAEGSTYNWQEDAVNHASDWYFESLPESGSSVPGNAADSFVSANKSAGADTLLSIPTNGWIAKLGAGRAPLSSFSVTKYGAQTSTDGWFPDAGNGILSSNSTAITNNDPNDAQEPSTPTDQQAFVQHEVAQFGLSGAGGVKNYLMDNEPDLWSSTHRDTHSNGPTMADVKNEVESYGTMVKNVDPNAQIVGPEISGWTGYFYSGSDEDYENKNGWGGATPPDKAANGDMDMIPWLLQQLHTDNVSSGKRILDTLSVHYYPQSGEYSNDISSNMQLIRNRSTRSLWDPNYVDESWIGGAGSDSGKVDLIPTLKNWVATYYPGTKTGITEYSWGAEGYIGGATAEADALGIFGREGLDYANYWAYPDPSSYTYKAFQMYRNYDGSKSTFGDTSVSDSVPNPDNLSSFAATRGSDGALTVMIDNKDLANPTAVKVNLAHFGSSGTAKVYQLTSANAINHLSDINYSSSSLATVVPSQSITLLVISAASATPTPTATPTATPTPTPTPTASSTPTSTPLASTVCLRLTASGKASNNQQLNIATITALNGSTSVASVSNLTTQTDGSITINTPAFVDSLSNNLTYSFNIKVSGYLAITIPSLHNVISQCIVANASETLQPGDFSSRNDGRVSLADIVTIVREMNGGTDAAAQLVTATLGHKAPADLSYLVSAIRNYNQ